MNTTLFFIVVATTFVLFYYFINKARNAFLLHKKLTFVYSQRLKSETGSNSDTNHKITDGLFSGMIAGIVDIVKNDDSNARKKGAYITSRFVFIMAISTIFSSVVWSLLLLYSYVDLSVINLLYFLVTCYTVGYLVESCLQRRSSNRLKKISTAFPDVLELLSICTAAGLSIDAAIHRLSKDLRPIYPEMSYELVILSSEINIFPNKKAAYQNFCNRTKVPHADNIFNSVLQAEHLGSSLSMLFKNYTDTIRKEKILAIEEKSAKLPTLLTVPMILFILPVLFIVLLGPAVVSISDNLFFS